METLKTYKKRLASSAPKTSILVSSTNFIIFVLHLSVHDFYVWVNIFETGRLKGLNSCLCFWPETILPPMSSQSFCCRPTRYGCEGWLFESLLICSYSSTIFWSIASWGRPSQTHCNVHFTQDCFWFAYFSFYFLLLDCYVFFFKCNTIKNTAMVLQRHDRI